MTVTDRNDDSPVKPMNLWRASRCPGEGDWGRFATQREQAPSPQQMAQRAGGFSPSGTTAMVNRETQLALPSSLVSRMSQTWVVRPM